MIWPILTITSAAALVAFFWWPPHWGIPSARVRRRDRPDCAEVARHRAEAAGDGKPLSVRQTVILDVLDSMAEHGPYADEPQRETGGAS